MATTGDICRLLAKEWGLPEAAVSYPFRALREKQIVPKGKRGKGGIPADAGLVADAIIVGSTTTRTMDVADVWRTYANLKSRTSWRHLILYRDGKTVEDCAPETDDNGKWKFERLKVPSLQKLTKHHSFRESLVTLIETVRDNGFSSAYPGASVYYTIDVDIAGAVPATQIQIHLAGFDEAGKALFSYKEELDYFDPAPERVDSDLKISRSFTTRTISRMADLLKEGNA